MEPEMSRSHGLVFVNITNSKPTRRWEGKTESVIRRQAMKYVVDRRKRGSELVGKPVQKLGLETKDQSPRHEQDDARKKEPSCVGSNGCTCIYGQTEDLTAIHRYPSTETESGEANAPVNYKSTGDAFTEVEPQDATFYPQPTLYEVQITERQLLSHVSTIYMPILRGISQRFVLWSKGLSTLVSIAFSHEFVMHTVLGWAATHLSKLSGHPQIAQSALSHRALALQGLQKAIDNFSSSNSDAILAASIVLSWQATDSSSWSTMICGTTKVKELIINTKHLSYIVEPTMDGSACTPTTLVDPTLQLGRDGGGQEITLDYVIKSLRALKSYLTPQQDLVDATESLITSTLHIHAINSGTIPTVDSDSLKPLREDLFWIPTKFTSRIHSDPDANVLISYLHAVALVFGPQVESNHQIYYRSLNSGPIEAMYEELLMRFESPFVSKEERVKYSRCLEMMRFPLNVVADFKSRLGGVAEQGEPAITRYICSGRISKLTVLENFPVGLWHNSL